MSDRVRNGTPAVSPEATGPPFRSEFTGTGFKKAKAEGYRARSAYKLIEIDDKFKIFKKFYQSIYIIVISSDMMTTTKVYPF